ncbi:hypothetical protein ACLOJK_022836, partial [Asimina triloba]
MPPDAAAACTVLNADESRHHCCLRRSSIARVRPLPPATDALTLPPATLAVPTTLPSPSHQASRLTAQITRPMFTLMGAAIVT